MEEDEEKQRENKKITHTVSVWPSFWSLEFEIFSLYLYLKNLRSRKIFNWVSVSEAKTDKNWNQEYYATFIEIYVCVRCVLF